MAAPPLTVAPAAFSEQTVRLIEQASGALATQSVAMMDEVLPWFRALPADQRSWVTLVAQAGVAGFVDWMRSSTDVLRLAGDVFGAAPPELTRSVTLRQTVEMVRVMIGVVEQRVPSLAVPEEAAAVRQSILLFSREIAFAAARVYAGAAESRGAWDTRLEALVIDGLVRDSESAESSPTSQTAALGWRTTGPVTAVVGGADGADPSATLDRVHRTARRLGLDCMAGVHGGRLVVVLGGFTQAGEAARELLPVFAADTPVVVGPAAEDVAGAAGVTRAALAGLDVAAAWPAAPRPVDADDLLPERALAGDPAARGQLVEHVWAPLVEAGPALLDTVSTYLDTGASLEATARALFVHTNTVRYRLKRVGEVCGYSPTDPREAYTIRIALTLGRLIEAAH